MSVKLLRANAVRVPPPLAPPDTPSPPNRWRTPCARSRTASRSPAAPLRAAAAPKPSASRGPAAPTSPRPSTGATRDRRPTAAHLRGAGAHPAHPERGSGVRRRRNPGRAPARRPTRDALRLAPGAARPPQSRASAGTVKRPGYPAAAGRAGDPFAAAAGIARLLDDEQQAPAVIVGHSVGVGVALALAVNAPRHVRALVLVGPAPASCRSASSTDCSRRRCSVPSSPTWVSVWSASRCTFLRCAEPRWPTRGPQCPRRQGARARDRVRDHVAQIRRGRCDDWSVRPAEGISRWPASTARSSSSSEIGTGPPVVRAVRCDDCYPPRRSSATAAAGHLIPIDDPDCVADAVLRALRREYRASLSARRFV